MLYSLYLSFSLMGAAQADTPVKPNFQLVGVYDLASLMKTSRVDGSKFKWQPDSEMQKSCGNAKAPYNMNIMEAEAVASGMMSTLVVLLKRTESPSYLDRNDEECKPDKVQDCMLKYKEVSTEDIVIGLGVEKMEFALKPMVKPRNLYVSIKGHGKSLEEGSSKDSEEGSSENLDTTRFQKLIKTQFELELCLEHKVGRAWRGGREKQLRQGFLLDPADEGGNDRKFFNGQRDPVSALIGPPRALLYKGDQSIVHDSAEALKGRGDINMTPSDIWGASLPSADRASPPPIVKRLRHLPFQISENGSRMLSRRRDYYSEVRIEVFAEKGTAEGKKDSDQEDVRIDVTYKSKKIMEQAELFPGGDKTKLTDILTNLPYAYPTMGTKEEPDMYVALMIPNWQIVEGLRRMFGRRCVDDTKTKLCSCKVRDINQKALDKEMILEKNQSSLTPELLNALNERMKCIDPDGGLCSMSNEVNESLEDSIILSPAAKCYKKQQIDTPIPRVGSKVFDGVGWVLRNPKHLFVQVHTHQEKQEGFSIMDYISSSESEESSKSSKDTTGFNVSVDTNLKHNESGMALTIILPNSKKVIFKTSATDHETPESLVRELNSLTPTGTGSSEAKFKFEKTAKGFNISSTIKKFEIENTGIMTLEGWSEVEPPLPNLMNAVGEASNTLGVRNWGYTVGLLSGRSAIVSLGDRRLSWKQSSYVQHAQQHSYFIVAFSSLCMFLFVGIRRFSDYWSITPQERAYYWPGRQADNSQGEPEGVDAENMEGGEEPPQEEE